MAEDVEGSSGVVVDGLDGVGHDGEEFRFGWNEDKIDLEFKTGHKTIWIKSSIYQYEFINF